MDTLMPLHSKDSTYGSRSPGRQREELKESTDSKDKERLKKEGDKKLDKKETVEKNSDSTDEEKSIDADDFAFGLGIACVVCK